MKAWVFQDDKQVKKVGKKLASHYVGWIDPDGVRRSKSCGPGPKGKQLAEKERDKIAAQLITGTYQSVSAKTWDQFREEYKAKVLDGMGAHNRHETELALDNFENIVAPKKMQKITTAAVMDYIAKRRRDPGRGEPAALLSPATINKELRHLRAVFRKAKKLGYLKEAPEFDFLKEAKKLPTYTTPEHFAKMYAACDQATYPKGLPYPPADWWRGVLITAFMTGWRIGSILSLRRADVDLDAGTAKSEAGDNKGKRDQLIALHPKVVEHMKAIASFEPVIFPWPHGDRLLYDEFERIQIAAEVKPEGRKKRYGFHDLRRAFATMNADRLTPDALQALMQHQDYQTTQRYINMARQLNPAVQNLYVPNLPFMNGQGQA